MLEDNGIYKLKRYFALALDPIHVGTGGYRIGRVDNTIVREPATGVPKIPGTTIEGCCRSYAYLKSKEDGRNINTYCAKGKPKSETEQPCGSCEICITFGYARKDKSMQALALFSDARILFFPVATMIGPVWITCPMVLKDAGVKLNNDENKLEKLEGGFLKANDLTLPMDDDKKVYLNFGWLLLKGKDENINPMQWKYKENREYKSLSDIIPKDILNKIIIVPDELFSTIVNSNLEVRTSIAIDPETGTVEERALFTYEAIPRGTVFWFDVIYQNPKNFQLNEWNTELIIKTVEDGLKLFEFLGVGGMGSRGFGRLKVIGEFLPFDKYLEALEKRLEILRKKHKNDKIQAICNYLKNIKSEYTNWIEKIEEIINKFCR